jgi:hypothetical protein
MFFTRNSLKKSAILNKTEEKIDVLVKSGITIQPKQTNPFRAAVLLIMRHDTIFLSTFTQYCQEGHKAWQYIKGLKI